MAIHIVGVFCEDIREEKSGQLTLVGILPDNINMPQLPPPNMERGKPQATVLKLGLYVRINMGLEDDPGPMNIKLVFPDGVELALGTIDSEIIATSKRQAADKGLPIAGLLTHVIISGFSAPGPGLILAALDTKDQRYTCAVLNLVMAEASELPPA